MLERRICKNRDRKIRNILKDEVCMNTAKLVIGILTHNRKELLEETLSSLIKYNSDKEIKIILVDNGSTTEYQKSNRAVAVKYGLRYVYNDIYDTDIIDKNIERGHNRLISELLNIEGEAYCVLEDDWKCIGKIPYQAIISFLNRNQKIGQVRIRDFRYDDSFYGGSSRNFVTMKKIVFEDRRVLNNTVFDLAEMHWVNACSVMRKDALEYMMGFEEVEIEKMRYFYKKYPQNAQLVPGIFFHIGPQRIRDDLRKKGLFQSENIS